MCPTTQTPIIIGVADVINRSLELDEEHAIEPLKLMIRCVELALQDACSGTEVGDGERKSEEEGDEREKRNRLKGAINDIRVVRSWTWQYEDICRGIWEGICGELANANGGKLDVMVEKWKDIFAHESEHGGNSPVKLLDEACQRVGRGKSRVCVIAGGEALGSLSSVQKTGTHPEHWNSPIGDHRRVLALKEDMNTLGTIHQIGLPIHIYPLYENAFRSHRNQTPAENNTESAKLYAEFAKIAARNEFAWNRELARSLDEEKIGKMRRENRMICWPYPLLMTAFNNVNMAASCIITSVKFARELGISEKKWIYPLGGAGVREKENFWERRNFYSSEALEKSLDSALDISGLKTEDIDLFDLYSCFPIVPKMAAHHLKIPFLNPSKPITLLGGLTSFGGAGNNYSLHAITEMTRQLRRRTQRKANGNQETSNGLILANGGVLTYQHVVCLSTKPRSDRKQYQNGNPFRDTVQNDLEMVDSVSLEGIRNGDWKAIIETYTVQFSRTNEPEIGFIVGRIKDTGKRFIANVGDEKTLRDLVRGTGEEVIGRSGWVWKEENGKRNLFAFIRGGKL